MGRIGLSVSVFPCFGVSALRYIGEMVKKRGGGTSLEIHRRISASGHRGRFRRMSRGVKQPKRQYKQSKADRHQEKVHCQPAKPLFPLGADVFGVGHWGGLKS